MTEPILQTKISCLTPFYVDRDAALPWLDKEGASKPPAITSVEKSDDGITAHFEPLLIEDPDKGIQANCVPSLVVFDQSYLPNHQVAMLVLTLALPDSSVGLHTLIRFLDRWRRLDRTYSFRVTRPGQDVAITTSAAIVLALLDASALPYQTITGLRKMITITGLRAPSMPGEDDLYRLGTISDPDEILNPDYVASVLSRTAYRRWQAQGAILVLHKNAGCFVIDDSNPQLQMQEQKRRKLFETNFNRLDENARQLVFQKAVLNRYRREIEDARFIRTRSQQLTSIEALRWNILQFTGKYQYTEEIDGSTMTIEISQIWRSVMLVDRLFAEVNEKLKELEQYLITISNLDQTRAISVLQTVFVAGAVAAVTAQIVAMTGDMALTIAMTLLATGISILLTWFFLRRAKAL